MDAQLGTFLYHFYTAKRDGEIESIEKAVEECAIKGLKAVDIPSGLFDETPMESVSKILSDNKIWVGAIYDLIDFTNPCKKVLEEKTKEYLTRGEKIGAKYFMPVLVVKDEIMSHNDYLKYASEYLYETSQMSKNYNIKTVIEDFSDRKSPLATIEDLSYLLEENKDVGFVLDTGNFWFAHEDVLKATDKFLNRTVHVHLKDVITSNPNGVYTDDDTDDCVVIGEGILPIKKIIKSLKDISYSNALIMEFNTRIDTIKKVKTSIDTVTAMFNED
jgi:sugar phosphate isomerase/epimerase